MIRVIAFAGKAGAGKSTAARHLISNHGYTLVRFADPLKNMLRAMGLNEREINGDLREEPCELLDGQSPRLAMQTLGTEWGRNTISPDLWVNLWRSQVRTLHLLDKPVVVDDMRFPNEHRYVKSLDGLVIKIEADQITNVREHESENYNLIPDHVVYNHRDAAFYNRIDDLLASF